MSREVKIEGTVTEYHFVNPHPFIVVDVVKPAGIQSWKLDMDNRSELEEVGMTNLTFKRGDKVVVSGHPIRPPQSQSLYIRKLDRPADGFGYEQVGNSPRIRRTLE